MNLRKWFQGHSVKLLAIRDTPEAIAGGVAIGIFFGFTPLFGLKTLLSLLVAWITRSNLIAAAISVTLHDLLLPFMPVIYRAEYDLGYWLLSHPHTWPVRLHKLKLHIDPESLRSWTTFLTVGKPLLLGSIICGLPFAIASFFVTRRAIVSYRQKHPPADPVVEPINPS